MDGERRGRTPTRHDSEADCDGVVDLQRRRVRARNVRKREGDRRGRELCCGREKRSVSIYRGRVSCLVRMGRRLPVMLAGRCESSCSFNGVSGSWVVGWLELFRV
jgi:hypothetical protein